MKIFIILFISSIISFANSFTIELKKDSWNLVGTPIDLNISTLNLADLDVVWNYKDGNWSINKRYYNYNIIDSLKAQDAFWVYSTKDNNITIQNSTTSNKVVQTGWTMYSPTSDLSIEQSFNDNNISIVWCYEDNNWTAWDKAGLYLNSNIPKAQILKVGQGSWVYASSDYTPFVFENIIQIGDDTANLVNGNFENIIKSSSDNIEDIWNISFKIDTLVDYTDFHIGVKFYKREDDGSDDIGEFVYRNISLNNGILTAPDFLDIKGTGDSASGGTYFYSGYNPNDILTNSIVLNNDILTLKLGLIMKSQDMVKESTFKVVEDYDIFVTSTSPIILNYKSINIDIVNSSYYDFTESNGVEGRIEIK